MPSVTVTSESLPGGVTLYATDCRAALATLSYNAIDSCVTDPPYHLTAKSGIGGFMGKAWDGGDIAFQVDTWAQVLRVLKPGAHLIAFSGTRTYHRMACAIEDAGFEIRDQIGWAYGSGFPKSHNAGNGWGTALKPAWEPIVFARKPLSESTVAANVLKWGTGAINIDGCRISSLGETITNHARSGNAEVLFGASKAQDTYQSAGQVNGRWPANIIHDGSDEVVAAFPQSDSPRANGNPNERTKGTDGMFSAGDGSPDYRDTGSAARFFYTAKADGDDRLGSKHPTVKPLDLMQYLVRLVTPKGGTVLDLFAGTGTTGEASFREGFNAVLIERETEYQDDIRRRMKLALCGPAERAREAIKAKMKDRPLDAGPLFGATVTELL